MDISYQSHMGHTILTDLTDDEVEAKFKELTGKSYRAFAGTLLAEPIGPIKSVKEARELHATEIFFTAPLQGG